MDIFAFYCDILEDEVKLGNVSQEKIKNSLIAIKDAYSSKALKNGNTFLDYNIPSHRCAYLFKFGPYHSELIYIYFRIFLSNVCEAYSVLKQKNELNICCLGGGAGTDIVGILRALVSFKCLKKKVSSITVLDICGGWRNSFKKIMQKLKEGQDGVSDAFLDKETLPAKLVSVDLTATLSNSTINIIKSADIISMVKFVSAVISKPSADAAFKNIANHMKPGATVIFIDNFFNNVYEPVNRIFIQSGLNCVFGPHHARFMLKGNYPEKLRLFGRTNFRSTAVSVLGWIKSSTVPCMSENILSVSEDLLHTDSVNNKDEDWEAFDDANDTTYGHCQPIEGSVDEEDCFSNSDLPSSTDEVNSYSDQSTQTEDYPVTSSQYVHNPSFSGLENKLTMLASRLDHLEYLVKNISVCGKGKCCSSTEMSCDSDASSSFSAGVLQDNVNGSSFQNKNPVNSHVFSSSPQNGCLCHKRVDGHNTPFLVLPVSRQTALQSVLFSGYNAK